MKRLLQEGPDAHGEVVIPEAVRTALLPLAFQIDALDAELARIDAEIEAAAMADERARLLMTIPGIGPLIASALLATVSDLSLFASSRDFAAFLGLVPRQHSSGGKERLGRISKMGDRTLRKLLVVGATSVLRTAAGHRDALRLWAAQLLQRKGAYRLPGQASRSPRSRSPTSWRASSSPCCGPARPTTTAPSRRRPEEGAMPASRNGPDRGHAGASSSSAQGAPALRSGRFAVTTPPRHGVGLSMRNPPREETRAKPNSPQGDRSRG